jgi:hypothetical protein
MCIGMGGAVRGGGGFEYGNVLSCTEMISCAKPFDVIRRECGAATSLNRYSVN